MGVRFMTQYSAQFKVSLAEEYLEGKLSFRKLAEKHNIPITTLRGWVRIYKYYGPTKLVHKEVSQTTYPVQFKLDVLSFMESTGASVSDTAIQFGIKNPSIISRWRKSSLQGELETLGNQKGLLPMANQSNDKKNNEKNKKLDHKVKSSAELERENELLRLEVAYLKKLRAFQKDPVSYLEKHKQRYHSNSKKNSN